jgi:single-strand DNA-binding protein
MELNKVILIGRLTRDPELSYTAGGSALCKLGLAVNRTWKDRQSGQQQEETCFVDVEAWGAVGEFCSKYFQKGKRIFIEGRLRYHAWDAQDGTKRSKLSVSAERAQFVDPRGADQGGGSSADSDGEGGGQRPPQRSYPSAGPRAAAPSPKPASAAPSRESFPDEGSSAGQFDHDTDGGSEAATDDDLPF